MAKGIDDDLRNLMGAANENARGAVTDVSNMAKQLREDLAGLPDTGGTDVRDRIDAARDRASQLRNRLGDFRDGNGNLAGVIDRAKLDDLRDRTAALRDRLHDLRSDRLGDVAQNAQNAIPNGDSDGDFRSRLTQQIDGFRDRVGNLNLPDTDKKDLSDRINSLRDRFAAGFDGDGDRWNQFHDELHDLRGRVNQLARERGDDDGLQVARDRIAAFTDNVHDYFEDRFDGRGIGDRFAERTASPIK